MPKMQCRCEYTIDLSLIPSPHQHMLISDIEYDKYHGKIDAEELYSQMRMVLECPVCKRLYIFWNDFENPSTCYKAED